MELYGEVIFVFIRIPAILPSLMSKCVISKSGWFSNASFSTAKPWFWEVISPLNEMSDFEDEMESR
jgi:hypothetical protein